MYKYKLSKELDRIIRKLIKKDKRLYDKVLNKIQEVITCSEINHYKNLRYDLKEYKRVHIGGNFVLIFKYSDQENLILFTDFDHHDKIYNK